MSLCSVSSKPTKKMTARIDVQFACKDDGAPGSNDISNWVNRTIIAVGRGSEHEVSVRVVDASEMQALNRDFRHEDAPTNVLSFPAGEIDGLPVDVARRLGDVVVCASIVRDEAQQQGKSCGAHWAHMVVHGTLHLLGFDHEKDDAALEMEGLETAILADLGIANPYGESPQET